MIEISIIIVSYNTEKLTRECIESLLSEGSDLSYEIIVVDNNSQDGSVAMLEKYARRLKNFRLIKNPDNRGFAKANNQAIKIAKGKYIFLLNSDTVVKKRSLEKLMKFVRDRDDIGVVGPKLLNADGSVQASVFNFPSVKNAILEYFFFKKNTFGKKIITSEEPLTVDAVVGAAFLITPQALKKVGMLNEKYFFYFEDIDYCREVWQSGLKVYFFPETEIIHYHGASGKNIAPSKDQWKRLIPSSKIYHGLLGYYVLSVVLWFGQKYQKAVYKIFHHIEG